MCVRLPSRTASFSSERTLVCRGRAQAAFRTHRDKSRRWPRPISGVKSPLGEHPARRFLVAVQGGLGLTRAGPGSVSCAARQVPAGSSPLLSKQRVSREVNTHDSFPASRSAASTHRETAWPDDEAGVPMTRRQFGKVLTPLKVHAARLPLRLASSIRRSPSWTRSWCCPPRP